VVERPKQAKKMEKLRDGDNIYQKGTRGESNSKQALNKESGGPVPQNTKKKERKRHKTCKIWWSRIQKQGKGILAGKLTTTPLRKKRGLTENTTKR